MMRWVWALSADGAERYRVTAADMYISIAADGVGSLEWESMQEVARLEILNGFDARHGGMSMGGNRGVSSAVRLSAGSKWDRTVSAKLSHVPGSASIGCALTPLTRL